jgi:hypothetical protein
VIAAAFWSVTLVALGIGFGLTTLLAMGRALVERLEDVGPVAIAVLVLLVLTAVCIGGGVAIGTVAWP